MAAIESGLTTMGEPDARIAVADDFVSAVRRLTGISSYSAGRGAGVVAAKTIQSPTGDVIVFNADELRSRDKSLLDRLAAHEAGHLKIYRRGEGVAGRNHLVDSEWQWVLLCLGALAIDEFRIERALAVRGYPVAVTGTVDYSVDAMYALNEELMSALLDPASSDVETFRTAVLRSQDWLTKHLAYVAAYDSSPDVSALPQHARQNWDDYIAPNWGDRVEFYETIADACTAIDSSSMDTLLLSGIEVEANLLASLGFRLDAGGPGTVYEFTRIASDELCNRRLERLRDEYTLREGT